MVVAAAVLVVGDDQQRLVPARAVAQRVVDVVDELLAERHVVVRVLAVAGRRPARLQEREGAAGSRRRGGLEVGEQPEVRVAGALVMSVKVCRVSGSRVVAVDAPSRARPW